MTLFNLIESKFKDDEIISIVADILDTSDLSEIEVIVNKLVRSQCNSDIEEIFLLEPSTGLVFGLTLTNGKKVILKIFNKNISRDYLEKMNYIQSIFNEEGFPAPNVLSDIIPLQNTHAGFYEFIEGDRENGHKAQVRNELAKYLAKFSEIVDKHQFNPIYSFMQLSAKDKLWPRPHNALFDFKKTAHGAGWIADKAKAAKKILAADTHKIRLAHTDWDVKNTIFKQGKLVGVFDWDALGAMSEAEMVGRACAQFTADWESGNKVTPTPEEAREFVKDYESYRGRNFSSEEYRIISASADYLIAMIARFEHAGGSKHEHPFQDLLKECGDTSFLFI